MKVVAIAVVVLNIAFVHTLKPVPFQVREVTRNSTWVNVHQRIYGGQTASEGQFPYMIYALIKVYEGVMKQCSASLLKPDLVLIAAHCVQNSYTVAPKDMILVGGKADLLEYIKERLLINFNLPLNENKLGVQERRVKEIHVSPKYDENTVSHDVALIKLTEPFTSTSIKTIPLATGEIKSRKVCTILGFGLTLGNRQNFKLNYVDKREVSTTKLGCAHKASGPFICLLPDVSGICQGDSGSPLVCEGQVWGVASHFVSEREYPDCGDSLEEYYSELYADINWIKSVYNGGNPSAVTSWKSLLISSLFIWWFSVKI